MDNEFNLERALAGEPIETVAGTPVEFVAYRPNVKWGKQLIVEVGTDICTYHANGRYHNLATLYPYDLHMKPKLKQIDWTKLPVDTLLTIDLCTGRERRYFSSFNNGMVRYHHFGATSKTADSNLDIFAISPSNVQIVPHQPWTVWLGGACPIPDGLEFEYMTHDFPRQVMVGEESASTYLYLWCSKLMYAYRRTGKVLDGWKL
jgi:hypothetical protein